MLNSDTHSMMKYATAKAVICIKALTACCRIFGLNVIVAGTPCETTVVVGPFLPPTEEPGDVGAATAASFFWCSRRM
jgi:hypothetical protein